jgi:hypothetical protein
VWRLTLCAEADTLCGGRHFVLRTILCGEVDFCAEADTFCCAEVDTLCGGRHFVRRPIFCAKVNAFG